MRTKTFAILAILIMILASVGTIFVIENGKGPSEASVVNDNGDVVIYLLETIGPRHTALFSLTLPISSNNDTQPYLRAAAADKVLAVASVASAFSANAHKNYAQIWSMTKEHWVRQAELETYAEWSAESNYDGNLILENSNIYRNNSTMLANAVAQINSFFDHVSANVGEWGNANTYSGKMTIGFSLDNVDITTTTSNFDAELLSIANAKGTSGQVFISVIGSDYIVTDDMMIDEDSENGYRPAYIYNFENSSITITGEGGSYLLAPGINYIDELRSVTGNQPFVEGIYAVSNATIGGDTLAEIVGSSRLQLSAGLLMEVGGAYNLATMDGTVVKYNNMNYNSLLFKVTPQNPPDDYEASEGVDIKLNLEAYSMLLDKLHWTAESANSAAQAIWNIYDSANAKNYNITTLMSTNVYDSVVLSSGMNAVMTISAMQQLATYYDMNGEKISSMEISIYDDSMDSPFVKGDVLDRYGNLLYKDVIFTPFFQSDNVTLERSVDYTVDQNTLLAIWSAGDATLNEWYSTGMELDNYLTVFMDKGAVFKINELAQCDSDGIHSKNSIEFKVTKVEYISPNEMDLRKDLSPEQVSSSLLKIAIMVAGVLVAVYGLLKREPLYILLGAGLIVFSLFILDWLVAKLAMMSWFPLI